VFIKAAGFLWDMSIRGREESSLPVDFMCWGTYVMEVVWWKGKRSKVQAGDIERENALIAAIMNLTLLRFLISHRVPRGLPGRFTETFTSHRRDP
jgi:hypothetical protein